jgi:hypothetical protein
MVDVGAASYQGLDVSDTIFLGKRLKEAGINNFMFHSFEPGKGPMARWGCLGAGRMVWEKVQGRWLCVVDGLAAALWPVAPVGASPLRRAAFGAPWA